MGWFSADEIVAAPATASVSEGHHTAQMVSLCVFAVVAVGYVLLRALAKIHRQHTERVAERATRRDAAQVKGTPCQEMLKRKCGKGSAEEEVLKIAYEQLCVRTHLNIQTHLNNRTLFSLKRKGDSNV